MTIKNIKLFRRFLKDKNLLVQYEYYLNHHLRNLGDDSMRTVCRYYEHTEEYFILQFAFPWLKTKEGYQKWCKINQEWQYNFDFPTNWVQGT